MCVRHPRASSAAHSWSGSTLYSLRCALISFCCCTDGRFASNLWIVLRFRLHFASRVSAMAEMTFLSLSHWSESLLISELLLLSSMIARCLVLLWINCLQFASTFFLASGRYAASLNSLSASGGEKLSWLTSNFSEEGWNRLRMAFSHKLSGRWRSRRACSAVCFNHFARRVSHWKALDCNYSPWTHAVLSGSAWKLS